MGLFRAAAVDAHRHRLQGHVLLLPRIPHTLLCVSLLIWFVAAALFLTQASYPRKATVRGWLEPASGTVRIYARGDGHLARWLVREGDSVEAGQPLAVVDGGRVLDDGKRLEAVLLAEYQSQRQNLTRQLAREEQLLAARQEDLRYQLTASARELAALGRHIETVDARSALLQKRRDRHERLAASGHVSRADLDKLREQQLALASARQTLEAAQARGVASRQELAGALARSPGEAANRLDGIRLKLSDVAQRVARLRGSGGQVIEAPMAGRVNNIVVRTGQRSRPDNLLLTLIPRGSPLVARLLVPVHAAGFLASGQQLAIRYDAYPFQKYGTQPGRVIEVADSATLPGDQPDLPLPIHEPVFRMTARPDRDVVLARGERVPLKSGMTLSADVTLERRTVLEWLLEPLLSLRGQLR